MLTEITPLILTRNEAPNIARTLARLAWAREVVIVDSCSTDDTRNIAMKAHPGVRWFDRPFTTLAEQWNFGLTETGINTEWVLALDADYILDSGVVDEMKTLTPAAETNGYVASFVYCINGQPLRSGVYPPVTVLFRRRLAHYVDDGHAHRVRVPEKIEPLRHRIMHDDRKPLSQWIASQSRYMELEADKLERTPRESLSFPDRVRKTIVIAPAAAFFYCLIAKGGILDGRAGWYYALQRATAELILSLNLIDRAINRKVS